jgi:uncharacterized membrane protein YGL010W
MGAGVVFRAMRTVEQLFGEYGESHTNPRNELLHFICVPAIVLTVIGFLWSIPVPAAFTEISPWLNWATITIALAIVYYFRLSLALGIGAALGLSMLAYIVRFLDTLAWPLWLTCLVIFVVAWIGQFVGHAIEGKRPSFFKDLQFLLIGPLWLLGHLYRRLGISY